MGRPFKCPCGASNSVAKGFRKTKTMGLRQIRRCRKCHRKFTPQHQKTHVAAGHEPKNSVKSVPAAEPPGASPSATDEWWKLNDEAEAPQPADEPDAVRPR